MHLFVLQMENVSEIISFSILAMSTMIIYLWGEGVAAPLYSVGFGTGLGSVLAPEFSKQFLSSDTSGMTTESAWTTPAYWTTSTAWTEHSFPTGTPNITTTETHGNDSRIEIPYLIGGTITLMWTISFFVLYLIGQPKDFPHREPSTLNLAMCRPSTCGKGSSTRSIVLMLFLVSYYIHCMGGEIAITVYMFSYFTHKPEPLSNSQSSLLGTLFFIGYTCGRFICMIISKFVSIDTILMVDIILNMVTCALLAVFAYSNNIALWVLIIADGFFLSILFPAGLSWISLHLDLNAMAVMLLQVSATVGAMIYQYVTGYLIQRYGHQTLMYIMVASAASLCMQYLAMYVYAKLDRKKVKYDFSPNKDDTDCQSQNFIVDAIN